MHTFRHSFVTYLLDQCVDIRVIQVMLGHQGIRSIARYSRVATRILYETTRTLDTLQLALRRASLTLRKLPSYRDFL
jgi:integrase/recombinase XerD